MRLKFLFFVSLFGILIFQNREAYSSDYEKAKQDLYDVYCKHCQTPYTLNEHLPTLNILAQECSSVVEIGVETVFSHLGIIARII